jgi:Tol biopolymer transport system component
MRRSVSVALACCVLVVAAVQGPTAATAAESTTGFTIDTYTPSGSVPTVTVRTYPGATASLPSAYPGSLSLVGANSVSLLVAPPTGDTFSAGQSFPVGPTSDRSDIQGVLSFVNSCVGDRLAGTVTVSSATYDATTLTSLAGTFDVGCKDFGGGRSFAGAIQFAAPLTYAHGRAAFTTSGIKESPVGDALAESVTVTNLGPDPSTPAAPTFSGANAGDYAVASDGCSGTHLAAGGTCTIGLTFTPAAGGTRTATLAVPMTGHPRAAGALFRLDGTGVLPPGAPLALVQYAAIGGTGLTWGAATAGDATTSFTVYRRADAAEPWVELANEVPVITGQFGRRLGTYVDDAAPGSTADYAVSGVGLAGEGAMTGPLTATRPGSDPVPGSTDALAGELWGGRFPSYDTRRAGETLAISVGFVQAGNGTSDGHTSFNLPLVPSAGTYTVVPSSPTPAGPGQVQIGSVGSGSIGCATVSGTWLVHEVAYDASLEPLVYAAQLDATCQGGSPVHAVLRWHSGRTYRAAAVTPLTISAEAPIGTPAATQPITVVNRGDEALPITVPPPTGVAASEWSLTNECPSSLPPGATCTVGAVFTPSAPGSRNAVASLGLGTAATTRDIALEGTGGTIPGAVSIHHVSAVVGRNRVVWNSTGDDGATGITGYTVYRKPLGTTAAPVAIGTTTDGVLDDRTAVPGVTYSYQVSATTISGEGPKGAAVTAKAVSTSLVYVRRDRFSGVGTLVVVPPAQGEPIDLEDGAVEHATPHVSLDGQWVVYARADAFDASANYDLWKRRVDGSGTPQQLTSLPGDEVEPAWSPNGATIAFTYLPPTGLPEVWTIPAGGGTAVRRASGVGDPSWLSDSARIVAVDESAPTTRLMTLSAAGAKTPISGTSNGWAPAVSPDGSRIAFVREDESGLRAVPAIMATGGGSVWPLNDSLGDYGSLVWRADGKSVLAERWADSWDTSGIVALPVVAGTFSTWSLSDQDGFDDLTEPAWAELDIAAPVVTVTTPPTVTVASSVTFSYRATDRLGVKSYDVRYRRASYTGSYTAYTSPAGWSATTATSRTLAVAAGNEYCFSVRARDTVGNVSSWSADRCVSSPLDDRSLAQSGSWSRLTGSGHYRSTVTQTTSRSVSLTRTGVKTRRITLLVTKCPTCGSLAVYWGSTKISSVGLYASTTKRRQLVALPLLTTVRAGTLTIRSTSSGLRVMVDGVAFRRT